MNGPRYAVRKARKDDTLYGRSHGSYDLVMTLCGLDITDQFWVTNTTFDGEITCKVCELKEQGE